MDSNKIYNVKNRSDGSIIYTIPELNVRREFAAGETKKISGTELEKLSYIPGGINLIGNYLQIMEPEILEKLGIPTEPEYFYTDEGIKILLTSGSYEEFLDALDFAPDGVIGLIKKYSVELPLQDYKKRTALKDKLGFDIDKAIALTIETSNDEKTTVERRVKKVVSTTPERRTNPIKVIKKG